MHQSAYRVELILTIYLMGLINAVLFDSLTTFPTGWLIDGMLGFILEKGSNLFTQLVDTVFGRHRSMRYIDIMYEAKYFIRGLLCISILLFGSWSYLVRESSCSK